METPCLLRPRDFACFWYKNPVIKLITGFLYQEQPQKCQQKDTIAAQTKPTPTCSSAHPHANRLLAAKSPDMQQACFDLPVRRGRPTSSDQCALALPRKRPPGCSLHRSQARRNKRQPVLLFADFDFLLHSGYNLQEHRIGGCT